MLNYCILYISDSSFYNVNFGKINNIFDVLFSFYRNIYFQFKAKHFSLVFIIFIKSEIL